MEPVTLITTALAIASPYLIKTGEKLAEEIGKDIWNALKKPFQKSEKEEIFNDSPNDEQIERIKKALILKVESDQSFKNAIEKVVSKAENDLKAQQIITNNGNISKQLNIQSNSGDITF